MDRTGNAHFKQPVLFLFQRLQFFFDANDFPSVIAVIRCSLDHLHDRIDHSFFILYKPLKNPRHDLVQIRCPELRRRTARAAAVAVNPALPDLLAAHLRFVELPVITCIMFLTDDFSAVGIPVVETCPSGVLLHLPASQFVKSVCPIPEFFRDNRRYGRVRVHDPLAFIEKYLSFTTVVNSLALTAAVPALVFGIAEDVSNGQHVECITLSAGKTLVEQDLRNAANAELLVCIQIKDTPNHLCLRFVDRQHAAAFVVAPEPIVSQHVTVFDCLLETEFQTLRELSHLILCHACHHDQTKLAVRIKRIDIIVLEQNANVMLQKLLCVLDAVQRRTREAGYLLRDDKIEAPVFGVLYHPKETIPLLCTGAADALVDVPRHIAPASFGLNQLCVVLHLIFQTVQLLVSVCGNARVKRHAQRQIEDRPPVSHFIADFYNVHDRALLRGTQDTERSWESLSTNVPNQLRPNRSFLRSDPVYRPLPIKRITALAAHVPC